MVEESLEVKKMEKFSMKTGWVSTDAWRGYTRPIYAVAGASDTGTWGDSPCPSNTVNDEIEAIRRYLKSNGVSTRMFTGTSSNAFMVKRWVIVPPSQLEKGKRLVEEYLRNNLTRLLHD
jgi:hypothetical protein